MAISSQQDVFVAKLLKDRVVVSLNVMVCNGLSIFSTLELNGIANSYIHKLH